MRQLRVLFLSICATTVAVAIWTVVLVLNLLHWLFGEAALVRPLAWCAVLASAAIFELVFYRYFNRVTPQQGERLG